ncbi:MAG: hypothetical protein HY690_13475 [Chloroflexi bacterium]|nr:hypothetical protein [Chloroflexota bacterium]
MGQRDELEAQARELAVDLVEGLVACSETVDFRMGSYLLAAIAAELGQQVQQRCWTLARTEGGNWELAAVEAEGCINAAWRCMATIAQLTGK